MQMVTSHKVRCKELGFLGADFEMFHVKQSQSAVTPQIESIKGRFPEKSD